MTTPVQVIAFGIARPEPDAVVAAMTTALATHLPADPAPDNASTAARLALFPAGTGIARDAREFLAEMAAAARAHGVWLCPGTWLDEAGHHVTGLFAPDGSLVATQAQTHLAPGETYAPGTDLALADTPFGPVGFLAGHDAWVPEVGRILSRRGARLLLAPVTGAAPYTEWDQIAGTWSQVQQNQVFAAEAGWIGPGYSGRPAVMAPCEMTDGLTGFLARPDASPAIATLDETARLAVIEKYDILGLQNPSLYERYLPRLYRQPAANSGYRGGEPA